MIEKNRLNRWKNEEKFPVLFEEPIHPDFHNLLNKRTTKKRNITNIHITKLARELIFDIRDNVPIIYMISPVLATKDLDVKLKYEYCFDIKFEGTKEEIEKEVINTLGLAVAFDVPIFPNNDKVEKELAYYYQKLVKDGFIAPSGKGEEMRLRPRNSKSLDEFKIENISNIDLTKYWCSSDLILLRDSVKSELSRLSRVQRTLTSLELAIDEFKVLLASHSRNENALQECLTKNPVLFGVDYINVIPKHRLGSEYEVDYALEKFSGLIDLMEIESSTLPLFTKAGNPSKELVHAEQQVIDWLDWIEKNGPYARSNLNGLITPKGFVVIGRNSGLNEKTRSSLIRRNKVFNGLITILTYDDLLNKAQALHEILTME